MNNKILSCLTLLYLIIQTVPALANKDVQTIIADCQLNAKQCPSASEQSTPTHQGARIQKVTGGVEDTCKALTSKLREDTQWNKLTKGIANGESISSLLYAFDNSTVSTKGDMNAIDVDYDVISDTDVQNCEVNVVPLPSAGWLFISGIIGFATFSSRRRV